MIAMREWSLIFFQLEKQRDLNSVVLSCRFFRTVLYKYPPKQFRVMNITSGQLLQSPHVMLDLSEKGRVVDGLLRLSIGKPNAGNMLKDDDIHSMLRGLPKLQHLRIIFSHLLTFQAFNLPQRCENLQFLTLWRIPEVNISFVFHTFPQLRGLLLGHIRGVVFATPDALAEAPPTLRKFGWFESTIRSVKGHDLWLTDLYEGLPKMSGLQHFIFCDSNPKPSTNQLYLESQIVRKMPHLVCISF